MRPLLCVLFFTLATPLCAQERLTNEQILAKLDDATAAEARWLLGRQEYAPDIVGFSAEYTREGIALRRLINEGKMSVFRALVLAESPATVCYAVHGISELDPGSLAKLIPHAASYRTEFVETHGDIGSRETALSVLADFLDQKRIEPDSDLWQQAWTNWSQHVTEKGPRRGDRFIASILADKLNGLPGEANDPVRLYAEAIRSDTDNSSWQSLIDLVGQEKESAAQLVLDWHARVSIVFRVLRGGFGPDADVVDLKLQLQAAARRLDMALQELSLDHSLTDLARWADFPWSHDEKRACEKHPDAEVRELGEAVFRHPLLNATSRIRTTADDGEWMAFLVRCVSMLGDDSPAAKSAEGVVLYAIESLPECFPQRALWKGKPIFDAIAYRWSEQNLDKLIVSASEAASSDESAARVVGARLLAACADHYEGHATRLRRVGHTLMFNDEAESIEDTWAIRGAVLTLWKVVDHDDNVYQTAWRNTATRWGIELSQQLVEKPKSLPPGRATYLWEKFWRLPDDDTTRFLSVAYTGEGNFTDEKDGKATASAIYKRMKEAAAKLE